LTMMLNVPRAQSLRGETQYVINAQLFDLSFRGSRAHHPEAPGGPHCGGDETCRKTTFRTGWII
jgi:hypothetical protein